MGQGETLPGRVLEARGYPHPFRRYQQLALDALEAERERGGTRSYLVLPPGAGKTVVGLEAARRLGRRTLVLAPNVAVQTQWLSEWERFGPSEPAGSDKSSSAPLTVLTYQALSSLEREVDGTERRRRVRARQGEDLLLMLHPTGRAFVEAASASGPWTLVLDECHHLLATWGALLSMVVEELGPETFVVGLTATPPVEMSSWEAELHRDLFDVADFEVPTPAVVKEGDLAPYQELVVLVSPTPEEDEYLRAEAVRFGELQRRLLEGRGSVPLLTWLTRRAVERRDATGAQLSWGELRRGDPALARAVLRLAHVGILPVPEGAAVREEHEQEPDADDWAEVLSDWCTGCLQDSASEEDQELLAEIRRVLPSLGRQLTKRGIRTTTSPVDRVCALSGAKAGAASQVLEVEAATREDRLRAVVLCDYETSGATATGTLGEVLGADAGGARLVHATLVRANPALRPVLLTGRTVACGRDAAAELAALLSLDTGLEVTSEGDGEVVHLVSSDSRWSARTWVPAVTRALLAGETRTLVGTRSLLGEGWDARSVNVVVDLTASTTSVSVHQMRGRSLRLDPEQPDKVASNWSVACVSDAHPRGDADYLRLVRKHQHYLALSQEGDIESGVGHLDRRLTPYGPPSKEVREAVSGDALDRAGELDAVRAAWRVGEPYRGSEVPTVRIRVERTLGVDRTSPMAPSAPGPEPERSLRVALVLGASSVAGIAGTGEFVLGGSLGVVGTALLGGVLVARNLRRVERSVPTSALEQVARAVADALQEAQLTSRGGEAVTVETLPDGYVRCALEGALPEESERFATSLEETLSPLAEPRYLVSRLVVELPGGRRERSVLLARRLVGLQVPAAEVFHAVPSLLATNRARAEVFEGAWRRNVGPTRLVQAASSEGRALLELYGGVDPYQVTTQRRTLWV